jgi:hypothetical protein
MDIIDTTAAATLNDAPVQGPERPFTFEFPAYKIDLYNQKVDKANRRLAAAGSDARFEFTLESITRKKAVGGLFNEEIGTWVISPVWVDAPWFRATQASELRLSIGDFTFLAALVAEEAGVTVHTAPGIELGGFVPAGDTHCDHCGTDRNRTRLYLVRNDATGEIIQLGHSCIELFTGFSPKGLFALEFDAELTGLGDDDEVGGSFGDRDYAVSVDKVIALAWAYSNEGRSYVSAKIDWKIGTGQKVRNHVFGGYPRRGNFGKDEAAYTKACNEYEAAAEVAKNLIAEGTLLAAIKASAETVAADSDYGRNLRVILAGETVSGRNLGILASIVSVYAREKELAVKRAAAPAKVQGFLAPVKTRIKTPIELTVEILRSREGDYGWSTWLVGTTPEGLTVTWNASGRNGFEKWVATGEGPTEGSWEELEVGDKLVLEAATVKAHETYQGTDQTVLTRAKVAEGWG